MDRFVPKGPRDVEESRVETIGEIEKIGWIFGRSSAHLLNPYLIIVVPREGWVFSGGRIESSHVAVDSSHSLINSLRVAVCFVSRYWRNSREGCNGADNGSKDETGIQFHCCLFDAKKKYGPA